MLGSLTRDEERFPPASSCERKYIVILLKHRRAKTEFPIRSWNTELINSWEAKGALDMPKGICLKANCPEGVINAIKSIASSSSGTCQYPVFDAR